MLTKLLLFPLVLHVLLITFVGLRTVSARIKSVRNGHAKLSDIATDTGAWPRKVRQVGQNFDNQFQTPMLWYAGCAFAVILSIVDVVFVTLSWLFLLSRLAHSYVHIGSNDVPVRMRVFLFGFAMLFLMWMWLAVKLLATP